MGKISLLLLLLCLALPSLAVRDCKDDATTVKDLSDLFWGKVTLYQLGSGVSCSVYTDQDMKVEFLSTDLSAVYFQYKLVSTICTAIASEKTYYSGQTLLTDYTEICGNYVEVRNAGLNSQNFVVFKKNDARNVGLMLGAVIITIVGLIM